MWMRGMGKNKGKTEHRMDLCSIISYILGCNNCDNAHQKVLSTGVSDQKDLYTVDNLYSRFSSFICFIL